MSRIEKIVVIPTKSCNFRCSHCGVIKQNETNFIPLKFLETMLLEAKNAGFKTLFITGGGEPLIDFDKTVKIINFAKKIGLKTGLNTNGYYIANPNPKNAIRKLKNLDLIIFSLDYDHLQFISYSSILKAIIAALNSHLKIKIKIINRKATKYKNKLLLKKLAKDLRGNIINISPFIENPFTDRSHYLIFSKKVIVVFSCDVERTENNKKIEDFVPLKLENILFKQCKNFMPSLETPSNILPCCSFNSLNNPKLYTLKNIIRNRNIFEVQDFFLKSILFDNLPFMKIFLRIKKDKKLLNIFMKKRYYSNCDFCLEILKHRKDINMIKYPSKLETFIYTIFNLHYVFYYTLGTYLGTYFARVYENFYHILINILDKIN